MKLELSQTKVRGEEWKRKNRAWRVFPPPDDGREWILVDEAAALFGIKPTSMSIKMQKLNFTRTCHKGVKPWLLKKEIMDYLAFLKDRERWYKRRRPKNWRPEIGSFAGESDEYLQRIFLTTAQAAAFMGVSKSAVLSWVKKGKIPVFVNRKQGKGGRNWYSPTSLRNLKEDEERLKYQAVYEKAKATMRAGVVEREVYKQRHKPRVYKKPIPAGWLTVREAADLLDIGLTVVRDLIKRGHIEADHLTGKWDAKCRPWFILRSSLEAYIQTEHYQRKHKEGKAAAQKTRGEYDAACLTSSRQRESDPFEEQTASGDCYDLPPTLREERISVRAAPLLW